MDRYLVIGSQIYHIHADDEYLAAMGDVFEPGTTALVTALVSREDVVADVGANIGLTALLFSQLAHRVLAFEPSPSTFALLQENLRRARVANVGLGSQPGEAVITYDEKNRSGGFVSERIRPAEGHLSEAIRIETLDDVFGAGVSAPTFLKLDVEGFEQQVLQGGATLLRQHQPTVMLEMNHFCLNVLHRIALPDFLDFVRTIFPFLYAVDGDNTHVVDMHDAEAAYRVMHQHVTANRYPNLIGSFDASVQQRLAALAVVAQAQARDEVFATPSLLMPAGSVLEAELGDVLEAGSLVQARVRVENFGPEPWHGYGRQPVRLCYHWQAEDGNVLVHDGLRTPLRVRVFEPRTRMQQEQTILVPAQPGRYRLLLTLVQEGVCWFEERGFRPWVQEVEVAAGAASALG